MRANLSITQNFFMGMLKNKHDTTQLQILKEKISSATKWCLKQSLQISKGAIAYLCIRDISVGTVVWMSGLEEDVESQKIIGENYGFKILYRALFNRSLLKPDVWMLKKDIDCLINAAKSNGRNIPNRIDSRSILNASCPKEEYSRLLTVLHHELRNFPKSFEWIKIAEGSRNFNNNLIKFAVVGPIIEEFLYRGLLQDIILKRLVKKIICKISPAQASKVDSTIYALFRIFVASLCFASYHERNRNIFSDHYVDSQVHQAFIGGLIYGILKEISGLSASIGAHSMNNWVTLIPEYFSIC